MTGRFVLLLLLLVACRVSRVAAAQADGVTVGAAYEPFVLPSYVPLAGYSRRDGKPSQGAHDPVGVRALVIRDGDTTAVLVSCELLIVNEHLSGAVRRRLLERGWPDDLLLMLGATHTHSGPGAYGASFLEKISMGHYDQQVFDALVGAIERAALRAEASREPVQVAYQTSLAPEVLNNRVEPEGVVDAELGVVGFFRASDGEPVAALVNFSAHPTTLGAWNMYLSGDYPGVLMREVERALPGTVCLFFAGSVGDQAPVKAGTGFERAEWIGVLLARQALGLLQQSTRTPVGSLRGALKTVPLPPAEVRIGRAVLPRWLGARLVDDDATLSVIAVGQTVFIGAPCDLTASLGIPLKSSVRSRGLQPVIVGFANDYIGYCVPESLYEAKKYESSMAFNGPKTGELIVDRLIQMIDDIVTRDPSTPIVLRRAQDERPERSRRALGAGK